MSKDLRARLASLPPRPWRIDEVTRLGQDTPTAVIIGALRAKDGRNIVEPSPESSSMILALGDVLEFLRDAPEVIEGLLDAIDDQNTPNKAVSAS